MGDPGRPNPLVELTRARMMEFLREPGALFWVFVFPVLLAVALGIAFRNRPPEAARLALVGEPAAVAWAERAVAASDRLDGETLAEPAAREALRTGRIDLVVKVEGAAQAPRLTYLFDPERPDSQVARLRADAVLQAALGRSDPGQGADEVFREPGGRYIDFLLPGLIGLNLMGSGMWGIGFMVVQARTRKLLKRYAATPMRRSHFLLSLGMSRLIFLVLELAALLACGRWIFGVRNHGSWLDLGVVAIAGTAAFTGLALLVGARPRSVEAASGWMNVVMLPMWVLSGSFFSAARFPDAVQPAIGLLPLTALNDALRAVMNDGQTVASLGPELAVLAFWTVVPFGVALRVFRWQ